MYLEISHFRTAAKFHSSARVVARLTGIQSSLSWRGDWADRGFAIVSGWARGMDSEAHRGALRSASGATVGVLGCAVEVSYPKEKNLRETLERRAIVAEVAMGRFPSPQKFPIRNRILASTIVGRVVFAGRVCSRSHTDSGTC